LATGVDGSWAYIQPFLVFRRILLWCRHSHPVSVKTLLASPRSEQRDHGTGKWSGI